MTSTRRARGSIELFQGMAGRLAGAALVLRLIPDDGVRALGDDLAARLVKELEAGTAKLAPRGLAHGWPGVVLAVLVWQSVAGSLPDEILRRAVIAAREAALAAPPGGWALDWAHGEAGMATLFARAYVQLGDPRFLAWTREAAARLVAAPAHSSLLLNGAPGVAYALLAVAAADPGGPWREAAWAAAGRALANVEVPSHDPYGVWSGLGGLCCLALDLLHETAAGFPGVEA